MHDEEGFLRSVLARPDDATTRLVYADWLEERGEFLRLHAEIAGLPPEGERTFWARGRLDELRRGIKEGDLPLVDHGEHRRLCGTMRLETLEADLLRALEPTPPTPPSGVFGWLSRLFGPGKP